MKKYLFILVVATTFLSCQNPQSEAESNINKFLKEELDNPASYEPVSFGSLKEINEYPWHTEWNELDKIAIDVRADAYVDSLMASFGDKSSVEEYEISKNEDLRIRNRMAELEAEFKENGKKSYTIEHTFRASNKFGAIVKQTALIHLDSDLKPYRLNNLD